MAQGTPGLVIGGRYRLERTLGAGGFGRVWAARDEMLETDVAVKELVLEQGLPEAVREDRLRRARREARNAAKLRDHPHIVSVHDVVIVDEAPWIVMQLVTGGTLQERLARQKRLSVAETAKLAEALLAALDAAHKQGIIHRDIKPANVMLTPEHHILLADFGIAHNQADSKLTGTGMVIGSPAYLSPERAGSQRAEAPSDLFSLGTTLYEAVEGNCPFQRDSPAGSLHAVAYEEAPPMRRAGRLEPLITALLEKDPADRPSIPEARRLLNSRSATQETEETTKGVKGVKGATREQSKEQTKEQTGPARQQATLRIENQTGSWLGVVLDDAYRETLRHGTTGTYELDPGTRKAEVKSDGYYSVPCVLHLKAGATESVAAQLRGQDVLLGSRQRPAERTPPIPIPKQESTAGLWFGLLAAAGIVLALLYGNNTAFADWVSSGLNAEVSSAQKDDCVHPTDDGEWVQVPCWSAATKYRVEYRVAASGNIQGLTPLTIGDETYDGCDSHGSWRDGNDSLQTVSFQGPNGAPWELCVNSYLGD
ncbi:serine/threonine-protein kinase [Streptomyces sp. T-3]|nr:serine/threonine-protein kinase [Streptomyces sp. T-3]